MKINYYYRLKINFIIKVVVNVKNFIDFLYFLSMFHSKNSNFKI